MIVVYSGLALNRDPMMKPGLTILLIVCVIGTASQALAARRDTGEPFAQGGEISVSDLRHGGILLASQSDGPTLSEAVEMVKRQYRGRIVSAETKMNGNREVHVIKVLTEDGKVKTVRIPGRSR
jgi:hypothetical protein